MIKLALIGNSRKSRTRAALYLRYEQGFKIVRLDDAVREVCRRIWGYSRASRVPLKQRYAVYDAIYRIDKDAWSHAIKRRLQTATMDIVIPDARYINEIEYLQKDLGFKVVRISRQDTQDYPRYEFLKTAEPGTIFVPEFLPGKEAIKADYSVLDKMEEKEPTYKALDKIVEMERSLNI